MSAHLPWSFCASELVCLNNILFIQNSLKQHIHVIFIEGTNEIILLIEFISSYRVHFLKSDLVVLVDHSHKGGNLRQMRTGSMGGTLSFIFSFLLNLGLLLKEGTCSWRSKFLPLKVVPILKRFRYPGKRTGRNKCCFPV